MALVEAVAGLRLLIPLAVAVVVGVWLFLSRLLLFLGLPIRLPWEPLGPEVLLAMMVAMEGILHSGLWLPHMVAEGGD